jgi:uncharacterized protein (TIGR00730 family)
MTMGRISTVTVFASSSTRVDGLYVDVATTMGRLLGEAGLTMVFGGGRIGLMGAMFDGMRQAGGYIIGVTTRQFLDLEQASPHCDELIVAETIEERKAQLIGRADAIIVLPGGIGTYEEFFDAFVGRMLGHHDKPIALVNTDHALTPLIHMIEDGIDRRFISHGVRELLNVFDTPQAALHFVLTQPPKQVDPSTLVPSGDWK